MKICGPKLSLCGLVISAWGIIQLVLMGFFYSLKSVALAEDLPGAESYFATAKEFYAVADKGYNLVNLLSTEEKFQYRWSRAFYGSELLDSGVLIFVHFDYFWTPILPQLPHIHAHLDMS